MRPPHLGPNLTPPERRLLVGDRRAEWRGSRRDDDWVKHFNEESSDRRRTSETLNEFEELKARVPLD